MTEDVGKEKLSRENLGFGRIRSLIADETVSESGRAKTDTLQPLGDFSQIIPKQNRISSLRKLLDDGNELPMESFTDLRDEFKRCRIIGTRFDVETLAGIRLQISRTAILIRFYKTNREALKPFDALFQGINPLPNILQMINRQLTDDGEMKDSASPNLSRIRKEIQQTSHRLNRETTRFMELAKRENWIHEENPTIREGRIVLPLKAECKRRISGIIHGSSATGATVYVEPLEMVEINNVLKELAQEEKEEIERILLATTDAIRPFFPDLAQNIEHLSDLDFYRACARISRKFKCHPVTVSETDCTINLINARHPLLQMIKPVVPLIFSVGQDVKSVIITGPNAGGKTVAMKTIGLLGEMAMAGLHIPADEGSRLPFFDQILFDIGDQQSIDNDLSTFSSHVSQLKSFIEKATDKSLILIDELGTGTEPVEGAALGQAVLEELIRRQAFTIVTTHHNALKAFADRTPNALNAAMEFDSKSLTPTFRIKLGFPGSSYALEISKRLGLSAEVIRRAHELMGDENVRLDRLLIEMETAKNRAENERENLLQRQNQLDQLVSEYESKNAEIRQKHVTADKDLADRLETIASESRSRIEAAIKEIREASATKETILQAKKTVEEIAQTARVPKKQIKPVEKTVPKSELVVGKWVRIEGFGEPGQITAISDQNNRISVEVGGKTIWVSRSSVQPTKPRDPKKREYVSVSTMEPAVSQRLDIRGMRADEAESALIRFLDQAMLAGLNSVQIIHGMGTGALQKVTRDVLRTYPGIKRHYYENFDRGGTGATIVEM